MLGRPNREQMATARKAPPIRIRATSKMAGEASSISRHLAARRRSYGSDRPELQTPPWNLLMGRQSVVAIWLRGNVEQYRVALDNLPRGPQACGEEALAILGRGNPELPDIARKCAADSATRQACLQGSVCFTACSSERYRRRAPFALASAYDRGHLGGRRARDRREGSRGLGRDAFEAITSTSPELLQAAHDLASGHRSRRLDAGPAVVSLPASECDGGRDHPH